MNIKELWQEEKAFTLMELLLATSLMALVICLTLGLIFHTGKAFSLEDDLLTSFQTGELAMEFMISHLRMASQIQIQNSIGNNNQILFSGFYGDEEGEISFSRYTSSGKSVLGFRVDRGVRRPLISGVQQIFFEEKEKSIEVTLVIKDKGGRDHHFFAQVTPRKEALWE